MNKNSIATFTFLYIFYLLFIISNHSNYNNRYDYTSSNNHNCDNRYDYYTDLNPFFGFSQLMRDTFGLVTVSIYNNSFY